MAAIRVSKSTPDSALHRGSEHTAEKLELVFQQLIHALIGGVALVEEVHYHHVILPVVAMASPNSLLDALRIPRQIAVHHEQAFEGNSRLF